MMFGSRADRAESAKMIDHALSVGIHFVDTADTYGANESERIVGEALKRGAKRDTTVLATKFWSPQGEDPNSRGLSRRHVIQACETSLRLAKELGLNRFVCEQPACEVLRPGRKRRPASQPEPYTLTRLGATSFVVDMRCRFVGSGRWVRVKAQLGAFLRSTLPLDLDSVGSLGGGRYYAVSHLSQGRFIVGLGSGDSRMRAWTTRRGRRPSWPRARRRSCGW